MNRFLLLAKTLAVSSISVFVFGACLPAGESTAAETENAKVEPLEQQTIPESESSVKPILPANNGRQVADGLVFAGQPTEAELRALAAAGYRVLDLRGEGERRGFDEKALVEEIGLDYRNVPVDRVALQDPAAHAAFREALLASTEEQGPLLVHCASGNRVAGFYYAFLVEQDGLDRAAALERARALGLTSAGVQSGVEAYLDRPKDELGQDQHN